jgi:hypothetical protein
MKTVYEVAAVLGTAAILSGAAVVFMSRDAPASSSPAVAPSKPVVEPVRVPLGAVVPTVATQAASPEPPEAPLQASKVQPRDLSPPQPPARAQEAAATTAPASKTNPGKDPIQDPAARVALFFVGTDPLAEAYWILAINDRSLSATERQDLIEDLNEDGISDPKLPGWEDLPLILARLDLIESLAPEAMDEVNADAFEEAYNDLLNLALVAMGGGEPVR